jgi:hypothetical protein
MLELPGPAKARSGSSLRARGGRSSNFGTSGFSGGNSVMQGEPPSGTARAGGITLGRVRAANAERLCPRVGLRVTRPPEEVYPARDHVSAAKNYLMRVQRA